MSSEEKDLDEFFSDEESNTFLISSKKRFVDTIEQDESDNQDDIEDPVQQTNTNITQETENKDRSKLDPMLVVKTFKDIKNKEQEKKERLNRIKKVKTFKKSTHKTGIIYLSKIPPYMKPAKMRQILSRFGEIDRLFLKREDDYKYKQRLKSGGNKKIMFEEGWVEFIKKKDAKLCASTLNGNTIGGKKGNFYHDDVMNVKYLSGFKWTDLTEQIARENDIKQAKLQLEISQANKLNSQFIKNVEKSKMIQKIKSTKKQTTDKYQEPILRSFKQRIVTSTRTTAPESQKERSSKTLESVLNTLF